MHKRGELETVEIGLREGLWRMRREIRDACNIGKSRLVEWVS